MYVGLKLKAFKGKVKHFYLDLEIPCFLRSLIFMPCLKHMYSPYLALYFVFLFPYPSEVAFSLVY